MQQNQLIFLISPPRSGSTLLQRMLGSHADIATHPEPHLITPLAYLGYYDRVDKAPYDHINAAQALKAFVDSLPNREADYLDALRAYTNTLYGRALGVSGRKMFLDKTPAYALVLPFLTKVYPEAKYVVLTRHPLAVFSSYAQSFFNGDWQAAYHYNPIVERYVTAIAKFMRAQASTVHAITYEALVENPERVMERCFEYLSLVPDPGVVNYADRYTGKKEGMGDPLGVARHRRPVTDSVHAWVSDLRGDDKKRLLAKTMIDRLDPADLALWGYTQESIWQPLEDALQSGPGDAVMIQKQRKKRNTYAFQRRVLLALRKDIHERPLGRLLKRVRYYCDVILRDSL